jgi:DnaJ-class molecular chaperone
MDSFYETLEVSPRASTCVIRAAYRCLVQHHHPDKNPDSADAGQRLTRINQAYAVLSDPVRRQDYDRHRHMGKTVDERRGQGAPAAAQQDGHNEGAPTSRPFGFRPLD